MVRRSVNGAESISTGRHSSSHARRQNAVPIRRIVQALEERKLGWVKRLRRSKCWKRFDHDVRMADDEALAVHLRGGSVIVGRSVGEGAALEVANLDLHVEGGVRGDFAKVGWGSEFGGGRFVFGEDATHGDNVAGTSADLSAIR